MIAPSTRIPINIKTSAPLSLGDGRRAFWTLRAEAKNKRLQDMTIDEIDEEINQARNNLRK